MATNTVYILTKRDFTALCSLESRRIRSYGVTSKDLSEKSTLVKRLGDEKAVIAADNFFLRASVEMLTQREIGGIQTLEVSVDKPF